MRSPRGAGETEAPGSHERPHRPVLELLPTSIPGGGPKQVYDLVRELYYASYSRIGRWVYMALERQLSRMSRTIINVSASQSVGGDAERWARRDRGAPARNSESGSWWT